EVTGCEVDLRTDVAHCGACGFDCRAMDNVFGATCSSSRCDFVCEAGFEDCDGVDDNGCEASLASPTTCGACGNDCTALGNVATASCDQGACVIDECEEGWMDCDGDPSNSCEVNAYSVDSCGASNVVCPYACGAAGCTVAESVFTTLGYNSCAILGDGALWCWGSNDFDKLGFTGPHIPTPTRMPLGQGVVQVAGNWHLCAVLGNGTV